MKNSRIAFRISEADKKKLENVAKENRTTLSAFVVSKLIKDLKNE